MSYAGQYTSGAQFRLLYVLGESISNEVVEGSLLFCEETQIQLSANKVLRKASECANYVIGERFRRLHSWKLCGLYRPLGNVGTGRDEVTIKIGYNRQMR